MKVQSIAGIKMFICMLVIDRKGDSNGEEISRYRVEKLFENVTRI